MQALNRIQAIYLTMICLINNKNRMSKHIINQYYTNLDRAKQFGKSTNEDAIKSYFWMLLNDYARKNNYEVVREVYCMGTKGSKVKPDGILKNLFGIDIGYWESKDEKDDIETEIDNKIKKGYPTTNILFEDSNIAVLFQHGVEVNRARIDDGDNLHNLITEFVSFKNETVQKFEVALENFKADIPALVKILRKKIEEAGKKNLKFIEASQIFLELCKAEINPEITEAEISEMMIQHILTSDIFNKVFDDPEFHKHNNIARELENLIELLFDYSQRKNLLNNIEHYYDAISAAASGIVDHHEKQKFLKVLYENFYKVYNPKAADRLGVVYTPNQIVQFMIESTDFLLNKYFGKTLADKNVEILDPATGTGTFITSLIDHLPKKDLAHKYKNEIHANEVAILPYYVANLNMEFTFKQKMGYYEEFSNLCFVDTLDNFGALSFSGKQEGLFGLTSENAERIKRQNSKKISVVIGNPPYNANQESENDNNKNREYYFDSKKKTGGIDGRIKDTYIKHSTAQKTKQYDMYKRFFRWASDRVDKNGIIAFVTNRKFLEGSQDDGFRKCVEQEFKEAYFIDLAGDLREDKEGNVFNIKVGVAISFLIKKSKHDEKAIINYYKTDAISKDEKLEFLRTNKFDTLEFTQIHPDNKNNWLKLTDNDFDDLIPVADKITKHSKRKEDERAIFKNFSLGLVTARDEWVYDLTEAELKDKVNYLIDVYNSEMNRLTNKEKKDVKAHIKYTIKWTRAVKKDLEKGVKYKFDKTKIVESAYRPFVNRFLYYDKHLNEMQYQLPYLFPNGEENNLLITLNNYSNRHLFSCLAVDKTFNYNFNGDPVESLPLYVYDENGNRTENITDWGLKQFIQQYKNKNITKENIFHYTYAALHNPLYLKKYELNLKREYPRLPYYKDFSKWVKWGEELMDLHINYKKVKPFSLKIFEVKEINKKTNQKEIFSVAAEPEAMFSRKAKIKVKLKADKEAGEIELDEITTLQGIPKEAWEYKLGNRSALEWILDQYKEKKYSDPTITEKFNTYHFADYKGHVIDLIKKITTVSVETMKIISLMKSTKE